jgi:FkbM family methyltransferase
MLYGALAALRRAGLDVSRRRPNLIDFLQNRSIECVLDVGANAGQFGRWLRNHGYAGRIISYEPVSSAYKLLNREVRGDSLWETKNIAIGNHCGAATINVGSNTALSSFLATSNIVRPADVGSLKQGLCHNLLEKIPALTPTARCESSALESASVRPETGASQTR